ncbi:uncharacterized protein LOC106091579 [Stomoxys calcitrans]|uniref:uncharacterized protein LOC106091579 n=1 Tax=Stomoxys calcitrans TaxID=35570 RepID=UPI0027E366BB|nr:uncharacterized protein LOC106091579 [Stomoxys calcitrans]
MQLVPPQWSKSVMVRPRNNLKSHIYIDEKIKFKASFEEDCQPTSMDWLLGWQYGHIWLKERNDFCKARAERNKPKYIANDYGKWLEKRKPKEMLLCKAEGLKQLLKPMAKESKKSGKIGDNVIN